MISPIRVLMTGDDLLEPAARILAPIGATIETMSGPIDRARMIATLSARRFDAILVRANPPLDAAVLDAAPALALISKMGAGVDSVDLAAATAPSAPRIRSRVPAAASSTDRSTCGPAAPTVWTTA